MEGLGGVITEGQEQVSGLSSQFSVLSSQFSVLSSQFSVLSSQFSVLSKCELNTFIWVASVQFTAQFPCHPERSEGPVYLFAQPAIFLRAESLGLRASSCFSVTPPKTAAIKKASVARRPVLNQMYLHNLDEDNHEREQHQRLDER